MMWPPLTYLQNILMKTSLASIPFLETRLSTMALLSTSRDSTCPTLVGTYQLVQHEDVAKIRGDAGTTTGMFYPCPSAGHYNG